MHSCAALAMVWASLSITPLEDVAVDQVDLMELNHFYDEHGKRVFDQIIFYDWCPLQARFNVRAWRLLKTETQLPVRDWSRDEYVATWHDGETLRRVRAKTVRESWTQYDPELVEREYLPKDQRRELFKVAANKERTQR